MVALGILWSYFACEDKKWGCKVCVFFLQNLFVISPNIGEHGIESLNAQLKADERIFASVRDETTRSKLMFKHHGQRMLANNQQLKTGQPLRASPN